MQKPKRELARIELTAVLIYRAPSPAACLAALALQIYLSRAGYDVGGPVGQPALRQGDAAAHGAPWWSIAGVAFIVSGQPPRRSSRPSGCPGAVFASCGGWRAARSCSRWGLGHLAAAPEGSGLGANVAASLGR